jgi:hypothetical protein
VGLISLEIIRLYPIMVLVLVTYVVLQLLDEHDSRIYCAYSITKIRNMSN